MESTTSAQAMEATPLIMVVAMQATHTPATTAILTPMMEAATPTHTTTTTTTATGTGTLTVQVVVPTSTQATTTLTPG